jgi:hypothetical protein
MAVLEPAGSCGRAGGAEPTTTASRLAGSGTKRRPAERARDSKQCGKSKPGEEEDEEEERREKHIHLDMSSWSDGRGGPEHARRHALSLSMVKCAGAPAVVGAGGVQCVWYAGVPRAVNHSNHSRSSDLPKVTHTASETLVRVRRPSVQQPPQHIHRGPRIGKR